MTHGSEGVISIDWSDIEREDCGGLTLLDFLSSFDNSAQIQGAPSLQKPQGSTGAVAAIEDAVKAEVVGAGGGRLANWVVKSISASGS